MNLKTYFITGLALLSAFAFSEMRIVGGMSNFDCYNDESEDCEGFEIEIEDFHSSDIYSTYGGSCFGQATLHDTGHSCIVRYFNPAVHLAPGAMTHFGVHTNRSMPAASISYRWIFENSFGTGTYTMTKKMPKHDVRLVTLDDGTTALRDAIVNTEPQGGAWFFVLPYRVDVPGEFSLADLMSNNPTVTGASPRGSGSDHLRPKHLKPGDVISDDDALDPGQLSSDVYWYKIYASVGSGHNAEPGALLGVMIDNTVRSNIQSVIGSVNLQDVNTQVGRPVQIDFLNPGSQTVLQSYLQPINADGNISFDLGAILTPGNYDVRIFGETWLKQRHSSIAVTAEGVGIPPTNLTNGDVNGDNVVDLTDYTRLLAAFNTITGDFNFSRFADLNKDGVVDLTDYTILVLNFNKIGEQ
ncbi:MAG: dockerin type I repeat-containing protein [Armatimonadetes bacterium]|nr:dockerin type I repeat-containing protein [Armatimonadota bacterium]